MFFISQYLNFIDHLFIYLFRYENNNNRVMSVSAAAQLLSVTLYYRRFFPYYAFNLLAGLDENGKIFIVIIQ